MWTNEPTSGFRLWVAGFWNRLSRIAVQRPFGNFQGGADVIFRRAVQFLKVEFNDGGIFQGNCYEGMR
jgi:hypothetical protein